MVSTVSVILSLAAIAYAQADQIDELIAKELIAKDNNKAPTGGDDFCSEFPNCACVSKVGREEAKCGCNNQDVSFGGDVIQIPCPNPEASSGGGMDMDFDDPEASSGGGIDRKDISVNNRKLHRNLGEETKSAQKVILDTDYGPFIDDVFALGLLANSDDLLDLQYVIASGEYPDRGAQCAAQHLTLANRGDVPVGAGSIYPDKAERGDVCRANLGFSLGARCDEGPQEDFDVDGVAAVAELLNDSESDDWWYIVLGGQTTLKALIDDYPEAASKISTLVVMGGNWCAGFNPYPNATAPLDETNIACDPSSANAILNRDYVQFEQIYYVPAVVADIIQGEDYIKIVEAAETGADAGAAAIIDFYQAWSIAGRADNTTLIHAEANTYDPATQSTHQFDACAVMLALEILDDKSCEDRMSLFDFEDGVHFIEFGDETPPRVSFSLIPEGIAGMIELPDQCPSLTSNTFYFDPEETLENDSPVKVALGFTSQDAKDSFYTEMAERMAGTFGGRANKSPKCFPKKDTNFDMDFDNMNSSTKKDHIGIVLGMVLAIGYGIMHY